MFIPTLPQAGPPLPGRSLGITQSELQKGACAFGGSQLSPGSELTAQAPVTSSVLTVSGQHLHQGQAALHPGLQHLCPTLALYSGQTTLSS